MWLTKDKLARVAGAHVHTLVAVLIWTSSLVAPAQVLASTNDPAQVFGVAHVDGKYFLTRDDFLNEGVDQILATGSKVMKLYLTPKRYPWNSDWPPGIGSLTQLAQTPYFKAALSKPFQTCILTVYALGRDDHYWTEGISSEEAAD